MSFALFLILTGLYFFCFIVQIGYYLIFAKILKIKEPVIEDKKVEFPGLSVIICAKNEAENLKSFLPKILTQDYPEFEIIVVNDGSTDDTKQILKKIQANHFGLKIVDLSATPNSGGKKDAFEKGISSADYDCLILTDADCCPSSDQWLKKMSLGFVLKKDITLGYSPYVKHPTVLNKLVQFDTYFTAKQYFSFAMIGIPYMGVGRNMGYRKQLFYKNNGFESHRELMSGDDDLFVNENISSKNNYLLIHSDSWVYSIPKQTFKNWFLQKKRHLTTGSRYKFIHKALLISFPLTLIVFYVCFLLLLGITTKTLLSIITGIFIFKILTQLMVYKKTMGRLGVGDLWLLSPIYEIIVFGINGILFFTNIFFKPTTWN